jgi:hypothetical protein
MVIAVNKTVKLVDAPHITPLMTSHLLFYFCISTTESTHYRRIRLPCRRLQFTAVVVVKETYIFSLDLRWPQLKLIVD